MATINEIDALLNHREDESSFFHFVVTPLSMMVGFGVTQTALWRERPQTFFNGFKRAGLGITAYLVFAVTLKVGAIRYKKYFTSSN